MVIHVKDAETDALVRRLAVERGVGITTAIKEAVEETLKRDSQAKSGAENGADERIRTLFERWDRLPKSEVATDKAFFDELWGEGK